MHRTQILFKNFEKHYKLDTELTWCEKMIGIDTNVPRHKAMHKRLGILRKLIYSCNHEGRYHGGRTCLRIVTDST